MDYWQPEEKEWKHLKEKTAERGTGSRRMKAKSNLNQTAGRLCVVVCVTTFVYRLCNNSIISAYCSLLYY